MTLPPRRLGDKGQRYELKTVGWPEDGVNSVGFSDNLETIRKMGEGFYKSPSCIEAWVIDRQHPRKKRVWETDCL